MDSYTFVTTFDFVHRFGLLGRSGWSGTVAFFGQDFDHDHIPGPT